MDEKPKRQLTPEQLENLKKGREKARLLNIQKKEIADVRKETKKEKQEKLKEEYEKVLEKKKQKEAAPPPPPKEEPEEFEEEPEEEEPPQPPVPQNPKRVRVKPVAQPAAPQPPPPVAHAKASASAPQPRQRAPPRERPPRAKSDAELYGEASIEILKKKLQQETRQRLLSELFNY